MPMCEKKTRVHIRWCIRRDLAEVLDIEQHSFEFPWYEDDFVRYMRQKNVIGMVAERDNQVVGYMVYELHRHRIDVSNLAVHPDLRYQSIGEQMVAKLISKLSPDRRHTIRCEIRERNLGAQLFFQKCGFRATNVLRNYYDDSPEDAYVFCFSTRHLAQ